jgi:AcrR family transcriptional regulator
MTNVNTAGRIPYRTLQALETKRRIAQAARRVFAENGYAASSLERVAREAGVAPRTVYASFGAKKPILAAICDEWLAESEVGEFAQKMGDEPDPRRRLALIAQLNRRQWEAGQDVVPMLEAAAASDADVATMLAGWKERRADMLRGAVKAIRPHLRKGLTWQVAAASVRGLSAPELYSELVRGEKWAPGRYEAWLSEVLVTLLLGEKVDGP